MKGIAKRSLAAAVCGFAALLLAVPLATADEPKIPDLTDLRDAVKAASKRGENVDEVARALDALEKALAKGNVAVGPGQQAPTELVALRDAVEAASRKGENVEAIRKELEAVEKAITGRALARPKPVPPPVPDPAVRPNPRGIPDFPNPLQFPDFRGGGLNPADIQKAQELMRKAMEMRLDDPNNAEALRLLQEATEMFRKAAVGGGGGLPDLGMPNLGRVPDRARLGIRMERVTPILVEQLGLEQGKGVAIVSVVEGSPAEKAGIKVHDILVEFAGKPVSDAPEDLTRRVNETKAGEKVDVVVLRKGKKVELKGIELAGQPAAPPRPAPRAPDFKFPDLKPAFPNTLPDIKPVPLPFPN